MKYALHFGLDFLEYTINKESYPANSPVTNVTYLHELSERKGFKSRLFTNQCATSINLINELERLSEIMVDGDLLFLSYSGHGKQISSKDENDKKEEVLLLYDRIFLDDEFKKILINFKKRVSIFILTNSCRNGTFLEDVSKQFDIEIDKTTRKNYILEDISEKQYTKYLKTIKYYLKDIEKSKIPIIHISSSSDNNDTDDSRSEGKLNSFALKFKEIIESDPNISYQVLFDKLKLELLNPIPHLELNTNCNYGVMQYFLNTRVFEN